MTNSDGGFQFDFQQPEKPVRPTVPPIPGQETAAYGAQPAAQDIPALQFPQSVWAVQSAQPTQFVQPAQAAYAAQPTQAVQYPAAFGQQRRQLCTEFIRARSGHDATVLAAIPSCGCRTSTTAGGSHAASSIRNTNRRCARPAAIRLGSDDAKLPPGGTDSAGDASSTSRTSGTGDIACFGSFKRRDTGVPTQSGRAACGRCRGNTSVPA